MAKTKKEQDAPGAELQAQNPTQNEQLSLPQPETIQFIQLEELERMKVLADEVITEFTGFEIKTAADHERVKATHAKLVRMRTQTDNWRKSVKRAADDVSDAILTTFRPAEELVGKIKAEFEASEKKRLEELARQKAEKIANREKAIFGAGGSWNGGFYGVGTELMTKGELETLSDDDFTARVEKIGAAAAQAKAEQDEANRKARGADLRDLGAQLAKKEDGTPYLFLHDVEAGRGDLSDANWPRTLAMFQDAAVRAERMRQQADQVAHVVPDVDTPPKLEPVVDEPQAQPGAFKFTPTHYSNEREKQVFFSGAFAALKRVKAAHPDLPTLAPLFEAMMREML